MKEEGQITNQEWLEADRRRSRFLMLLGAAAGAIATVILYFV